MVAVRALALASWVVVAGAGASAGWAASVPSGAAGSNSSAPSTVWMGVTLGEPRGNVRAGLGKPREILATSAGVLWRYDTDSGNATLELLMVQDQVVNVAVRAKSGRTSGAVDPFGAGLGMSAQALQKLRGTPLATYDGGASIAYGEAAGVRWFYTVDGGVVTSIAMSKPLPPQTAAQVVAPAGRDGTSMGTALLINATTQTEAANAELTWLHGQACDRGGAWQIVGEALVAAAGHFYDQVDVACSTSKRPRRLFFDVTSAYPR